MPNVGNSNLTSSRNNPLVTAEMQPKVCSICAGPIGSSYSPSSSEASEAVAPACVNCSRTADQQDTDTPMNDATNATIVDSAMGEDSEQLHRSGTSDDIQPSMGNIIKDNNTTKPSLKVIKVDFPGRSNPDSVTPSSPVQGSLVSARTMSLRSPVAEHTLSAALKAHIQRQSLLDPFLPLTSTRVPSRGYDCLYPGALFEGVQTNKTKEHRVSVRIVDVNTDQSTLSGFLTIHDLTDQYPEITTFFDGQIIGGHYGFVTNDWGATEKIDHTHWSQFQSYKEVQPSELTEHKKTFKNPSSTIDRGFVFMRWKERFLVPDHRLKTINGASYAGFYYICVEFGSLMGGLHSDALNPYVADEMEEDDVDSAMAEDGWSLPESGSSRTRGPRRSSSRAHSSSIRTSSTSRRAEDKSPPRAHTIGYTHGQSPYAASSSHAPSTSPVTGANRIARAHPTTGRRRRLSIFTAGSVHSHVHEHGHGHSHGSPSYVPSGYGVGSPPFESGSSELASRHLLASRELELELNAVEDREMGLEEALGLDPVEELGRQRRREVERTETDRSRSRSTRRRDDECDDAREYGYGYGRRGTGWMGPARLTGYYNHSEKDNCDLYQKLVLHHVPERTRGSFEFR